MITQNDIASAVTSKILGKYPGETVYTNIVPSGFKRPSFYIEGIGLTLAPDSCGAVEITAKIHIVCFENVDAYHNSQIESLNIRQMAVMGLFAPLYLRVGDRALDVAKLEGGAGGQDWADVTVTLAWEEDITEFEQIAELPTMETVAIRLEE